MVLYYILLPLAWLVFHIGFRVECVGRENLKKVQTGGCILAPNHVSAIDPVFVVITRFWGKRMVVFAKKELFEINALLTWFFRCMGALCVRGTRDELETIDKTVEVCKNGGTLLIFPEGTRSHDGEIHRFKAGAFTLAREAGVEILPVVLDGTTTMIGRNGMFNWRNKLTVSILPPVSAERVAAADPKELMEQVRASMCVRLAEIRKQK